jgi:hypothetical protein
MIVGAAPWPPLVHFHTRGLKSPHGVRRPGAALVRLNQMPVSSWKAVVRFWHLKFVVGRERPKRRRAAALQGVDGVVSAACQLMIRLRADSRLTCG